MQDSGARIVRARTGDGGRSRSARKRGMAPHVPPPRPVRWLASANRRAPRGLARSTAGCTRRGLRRVLHQRSINQKALRIPPRFFAGPGARASGLWTGPLQIEPVKPILPENSYFLQFLRVESVFGVRLTHNGLGTSKIGVLSPATIQSSHTGPRNTTVFVLRLQPLGLD